jgi:phage shock protein C
MSIAVLADQNAPSAADERDVPLPLRADTFLGVFEAIGQDLGFHPNLLRVPFAALLLWNPAVIVGAYLGLGGIVALSRRFYPAARPAAAQSAKSVGASETPASVESADSEELLAA